MIALDTNVLVRLLVRENVAQHETALAAVAGAASVYVSIVVLCELVWVLTASYRYTRLQINDALLKLGETEGLVVDEGALQAGLDMHRRGGDFADGVVLFEAQRHRCDTVMTFDRRFARTAGPGVVLLDG